MSEKYVELYPESKKMQDVSQDSQKLGKFLEYIMDRYSLVDINDFRSNNSVPIGYSSNIDIEHVLADYFDIDLNLVEEERRKAIDYLRNSSK